MKSENPLLGITITLKEKRQKYLDYGYVIATTELKGRKDKEYRKPIGRKEISYKELMRYPFRYAKKYDLWNQFDIDPKDVEKLKNIPLHEIAKYEYELNKVLNS